MKSLFQKIVITCLCAASLWGCQRKGTSFVEMELKGGQGRTVCLYEISATQGSFFIDSLQLDADSRGRFRFPDDSAKLYALSGQGNANILFLIPLPGEELHLQATYDSLVATAQLQSQLNSIEHPSPSLVLLAYQKKSENGLKELEKTEKRWTGNYYRVSNRDSLYQACVKQSDSILLGLKQEAKKTCQNNTDNLAPIFIFNKMCGTHPIFDPLQEEDWNFMYSCTLEMQKSMPRNPHVQRMLFNLKRIESARRNEALQQEMDKRKGGKR